MQFSNCIPDYVKVDQFFRIQGRTPVFLHFGIVYKFKCGGCIAIYYGKTKHHFKVRMCNYFAIIHPVLTLFPY